MSATRTPHKKTASPAGPAHAPGKAARGERSKVHGTHIFLLVLFLVSAMAGLHFSPTVKVYVAGEIAGQDIVADQDILVEDAESTRNKRQQVEQAQPPVFDLSREASSSLESRVREVFDLLGTTPSDQMEQVRGQIAENLNSEINSKTFRLWQDKAVQNFVLARVTPWLGERLDQGVVADSRVLAQYRSGLLVRDLAAEEQTETLRVDVRQIDDLGSLTKKLENALRREFKKPLQLRKAILALVEPLLGPSLTWNQEASQARRQEVADAVELVYSRIKKGEIIVRQGERVTPEMQFKLQALFVQQPEYYQVYRPLGVLFLGVFLAAGLLFSSLGKAFKPLKDKDVLLLSCLVLVFAGMAKTLSVLQGPLPEEILSYVLPVAGAGGLMALFFGQRICFFANLLIAFLCAQMVSGGLGLFAFYFLGAMLNSVLMKRAQSRPEVLKSVFPLLAGLLFAWVGASLLQYQGAPRLGVEPALVLLNGVLSLLMVLALSPVVELVFRYTSRFRLMELMNLEQPLLQELMVAAPGTYHHCLIVSNMVEAGTKTVGGDPLLCKVAALYHDIGKVAKPNYFIENQMGRKNVHDKLAPSMSALILISHVKTGVEMARRAKLGKEIKDIIEQHHGTSLISYFHHKAREQAQGRLGETVREEDYRYPGPKPQTREAAVVMLADAIEASSRVLADPQPSRIQGHIEATIKRIFTEGQLDESPLTLKDLHLLGQTFHRVLTGTFHQRIEYPEGLRPPGPPGKRSQPQADEGKVSASRMVSTPGESGNGPVQ